MLEVVKDVIITTQGRSRQFLKCKVIYYQIEYEYIYIQDKLNEIDLEYFQDGLNRFK
jgi:hypothetical protein